MPDPYVISVGQDEMIGFACGDGPAAAVESYYASLDVFSDPSTELTENFSVSVLRVPDAIAEQVEEIVDQGGDDLSSRIDDLVAGYEEHLWQVVNASYKNGDFSAHLRT